MSSVSDKCHCCSLGGQRLYSSIPRIVSTKILAQELLEKALECEKSIKNVWHVCKQTDKCSTSSLQERQKAELHSTKRRKVWENFNIARMSVIPPLWTSMMSDI